MPASGSLLADRIRDEIRQAGPMPLDRFMELALYHPTLGYYTSRARERFGVRGDFYTAEQLQPVYGMLLRWFVEALAGRPEAPASFQIVELGSGRGEMAVALQPWSYLPVDWHAEPWPSTPVSGLVVANEFFDALPVRLYRREHSGWQECRVTLAGDELTFCSYPLSSAGDGEYLETYGRAMEPGSMLEVPVCMAEWLSRIARTLQSGWVFIVDYEFSAEQLPEMRPGTLLAYRNHQASTAILSQPGEQDLTAHVNFTFLEQEAARVGLRLESDTSLRQWALGLRNPEDWAAWWREQPLRNRLQWKQLVVGMGETFRVCLLRKASGQ